MARVDAGEVAHAQEHRNRPRRVIDPVPDLAEVPLLSDLHRGYGNRALVGQMRAAPQNLAPGPLNRPAPGCGLVSSALGAHAAVAQPIGVGAGLQSGTRNRSVQRLVDDGAAEEDGRLADRIEAAGGSGSSIEPDARGKLERGLGATLGHVRIHDDAESDAMARSVSATAFTTGSDIFFRRGAYQPGSPEGLHLLAHEATHTLQQAAGGVEGTETGGITLSDPSDRHEQAAEAAADGMMSRSTDPPSGGAPQMQHLGESNPDPAGRRSVQRFFDEATDWLTGTAGRVGDAASSVGGSVIGTLDAAAHELGTGLDAGISGMGVSGMGIEQALTGGYEGLFGAEGGLDEAARNRGSIDDEYLPAN